MDSKSANLFLENQLCFPIYATSRLITRLYTPYLKELELTYPQYLVMLVLWEKDKQKVSEIGNKLLLNTNTITPLIHTMTRKGLLEKTTSPTDERLVIVRLTQKGNTLKSQATSIPKKVATTTNYPNESAEQLKSEIWKMLNFLQK